MNRDEVSDIARAVRERHRQGGRPDGSWGCLGCDWEQDMPHRDHVADMVAEAVAKAGKS